MRLRITGDLGEKYDVTTEDWDILVSKVKESQKSLRLKLEEQITNQEAWWNGDTDSPVSWNTIAEFDGAIENN